MALNKLASAILRGSWLLEPRQTEGLLPLAERFLSGEKVSWFDDDDDEDPFLAAYVITPEGIVNKIESDTGNSGNNIFKKSPQGSVCVIPITGTIMKEDNCGTPGTDTMSSWLRDAVASPNIAGCVLHINSGGGTVEGTAEFAALIADASTKMPMEAFTDGTLCSAAYWLGSPLNITASSETVEVGSIGTAMRFTDYSKMYSDKGIKEHYVNADKSVHKNEDFRQAKAGNYDALRENLLNPTNEVFLNAIKANRPDLKLSDVTGEDGTTVISQEPLSGKTYLAKTAINLGLINGIGDMASVINKITSNQSQKKKDMGLFGSKLKSLEAIKGLKAAEITEEMIEAIQDELKEAGYEHIVIMSSSHLDEANANADALTNGLAAANTALKLTGEKAHLTIGAAVTALIADRDAEYTRAETYGKQPGAKPTIPKTTQAVEGEAPAKEQTDYQKKMARRVATTVKTQTES